MPVSVRVLGVDVCVGGAPTATHVSKLLGSRGGRDASARLRVPLPPAPPDPPAGMRASSLVRTVGVGHAAWRRAAAALETGRALDLPWARFWRGGKAARWAPGDPVVVGARVGPPGIWVANVNRVVEVVRTRRRVAVAWGTTDRHVLLGEEVIAVERAPGGEVVFSLRSYSRPRTFVAWLGYPYVVFLQRRFARGVANRLEQIAAEQER